MVASTLEDLRYEFWNILRKVRSVGVYKDGDFCFDFPDASSNCITLAFTAIRENTGSSGFGDLSSAIFGMPIDHDDFPGELHRRPDDFTDALLLVFGRYHDRDPIFPTRLHRLFPSKVTHDMIILNHVYSMGEAGEKSNRIEL
jgi:hypothetical protein